LTGGSSTDVAYVMDDGLTSVVGNDVQCTGGSSTVHNVTTGYTNGDGYYFTFIGTGITLINTVTGKGTWTIAQNLPYGTHILKHFRGSTSDPNYTIDGVALGDHDINTYSEWHEVIFHQPKMPPIPEDAVVIADYMLMADFVPITSEGIDKISKGVKSQSLSRDVFFNTSNASFIFQQELSYQFGFRAYLNGAAGSNTSLIYRLPSFATNFVHRGFNSTARVNLYIGDTEETGVTAVGTAEGSLQHLTSDKVLDVYNLGANAVSGENAITSGFEIATPIHTSSHYQTFETPLLHELVGGDRNMEQTNLVVTADGKTWDEVTRDTKYIGTSSLSLDADYGEIDSTDAVRFDEVRGYNTDAENVNYYTKDFAVSHDRQICLRSGEYKIHVRSTIKPSNSYQNLVWIRVNGYNVGGVKGTTPDSTAQFVLTLDSIVQLQRGDYVQVMGGIWANTEEYSAYHITRL